MNCPFCDESINAAAKYCPKCGLPLKEDQTVMGAYVVDDTGPNPWVLGGGAVALVAIALSIGWMGSKKGQPTQTVRREPVSRGFSPSTFGGGGFTPTAPSAPFTPFNSGFSQPTTAAQPYVAGGNSSTKYYWNPPPAPPARARRVERPEPAVPSHAIAQGLRPPRASQARVVSVRPATVPPPTMMARTNPSWIAPLPTLNSAQNTVALGADLGGQANAQNRAGGRPTYNGNPVASIRNGQVESIWVFDPVQERWTRQNVRRRNRVGGGNGDAVVADSSRQVGSPAAGAVGGAVAPPPGQDIAASLQQLQQQPQPQDPAQQGQQLQQFPEGSFSNNP